MKKSLCTSLMLCLLVLTSCSVKEDRSDCPCILTIDLSSCQDDMEPMSLKGWMGSSILFEKKARGKDYPEGVKIMVPRGNVSYSVHSAVPSYHKTGSTISCPTGSQGEPLFAYRQTVVAAGEKAYDKVILHKQHAVLNLSFGLPDGDSSGITKVIIHAPYNGMSIHDLSPVKGSFSCSASESDGFFSIVIPRQGKGSIIMEAYAGNELVRFEDIADILEINEYNWEAEDLDDVWIDFDMGTGDYTIEVEEWEEGASYPGII